MTEEVQGSVSGGNGRERMEIRFGTRAIGIQAKDLIPILLLCLIGVGGFLIYGGVREDLGRLYTQQNAMQTTQNRNLLEATELWRGAVNEMKALVYAQRNHLDQQREMVRRELAEQAEALRKLMVYHDMNQGRDPDNRIPLEFPQPMDDQDKAKQR
jgi:hypothetical protein